MPMHHPTPERRSCGTTRLALGMFALWGALMLAACVAGSMHSGAYSPTGRLR